MKRLSFDEKLSEIRKYYVENPQQVEHEVSVCLYNIKNINIEKKVFYLIFLMIFYSFVFYQLL